MQKPHPATLLTSEALQAAADRIRSARKLTTPEQLPPRKIAPKTITHFLRTSAFAFGGICTVFLLGIVTIGESSRVTNLSPEQVAEPPPPPPISLNQLSNLFANYPICDSKVPACQVSQENALSSIFSSANSQLSFPGVTGFTVRVDNVEKNESGGTWDVRGKVTWDLGDENATAATGVGMAMGLVNMMSGGTIIDGVGMAANVASESYKQIGKCLTSTSLGDVPKTQISVNLKGVNIANLEGVKEGAFITVTGASILPFKPYQGLFGDRASSFSTPGNNSYGEIVVYGQDGSATFAGEKISTKEFCRTK